MRKTGPFQLLGERDDDDRAQWQEPIRLENHNGAMTRLFVVLFRLAEIDQLNLPRMVRIHARSSKLSISA